MSMDIYVIAVDLLLLYLFYQIILLDRKKKTRREQTMAKQILCDKLSQSGVRVKLQLVIENGKEDKFADYSAVYGYPNYLFRTDSRQKWTNEETEGNFCLFRNENLTYTDWKYYEERQILNLHLREEFYLLADGKRITGRGFYKRIRFFNLWFADEGGKVVNLAFTEEITAMIMAVMKKLVNDKRMLPLCAVGHADEGISHVHFLYYIKPPYKNIPAIREILKGQGIDIK